MKIVTKIILIAVVLFSGNVQAKLITLKGASARNIIESLSAAGFPILNLDKEWGSNGPLSVVSGPISCSYNFQEFPDDWLTSVACYQGESDGSTNHPTLPNSFGLAKAIQKFSDSDVAGPTKYFGVSSVHCSLDYKLKAYQCEVDDGT